MIYAYGCGGVHIEHTRKPTSVAAIAVCVVADTMDEADVAAESIANGDVACGWAFDAGMREAESEDAGGAAFDWMMKYRDASRALEWEVARAVAADRARIAQAIRVESAGIASDDYPMTDEKAMGLLARLLRVVEGG